MFRFKFTPGVAVINDVPFSLIEVVALMFTQLTFVMHAFAVEILVGLYVPMLRLVAVIVVHETVTIDAFTPLMFTNEHVTIDALLQLKLKKLADKPDTEINDTDVNLHV